MELAHVLKRERSPGFVFPVKKIVPQFLLQIQTFLRVFCPWEKLFWHLIMLMSLQPYAHNLSL